MPLTPKMHKIADDIAVVGRAGNNYTYLRYAVREIDENDETVKKYVNAGMFLQ